MSEGRPLRASNWVEALLYGALARGVNRTTLVVLNLALLGCIGLLVSLLLRVDAELALHLSVLLLLAVGLLVSVNWVISQTGLVSADQQKRQLFGSGLLAVERTESSASSSDRKLD